MQLKRFIETEYGNEAIHLIGHSMGGLDSRYLISKLGMENRILTLTTVGTPHRGSPFADWGVKRFSRVLRPLLRYFHLPHQAFFDLMTESCQQFNEEVPDAPEVRYFSIAGKFDGNLLGPEWWLPAKIVREAEGENDGVVSVASASYGESCEVWEADHLNLVNWPNRRARRRGEWQDRAADYGRLVGRLCELGYAR
jgi:triacylglycerol lipase